jgi:glycosyltransferase involved in cell wall biosynthesis
VSDARLTLCLIARDEERMLPGCLESARGAVDEVVVVDTGSSDRTRELARAAGAKVVEWAWRDDFAAARNEALRHATGGWILVLDADERLAPGAAAALRRAVAGAAFDLGLLLLHGAARPEARPEDVVAGRERLSAPMRIPRLVRRTPDLAWRGVVHENVRDWLAARGGRAAPVDVDVVHLGASAELRARLGKRERNTRLLREACRRDPRDVVAAGYLALELQAAGRLDEAAAVAEAAWGSVDLQPPHVSIHRLAVARALVALRRGDLDRVLDSVATAERRGGRHADTDHLRGVALENRARALPRGEPGRRELAGQAAAAYEAAIAGANTLGLDHLVDAPFGEEGRTRLAAARALAAERGGAPAPRISLCVIARDEEAMLPGLLASVAGAVDEIVVVDTGSTDRTVDVARAAGARVASHAWSGDFAAARNASLALAGGDFVLVLDADERLAPGAAARLREAASAPGLDAALLACHNAARAGAALADVLAGRERLGEPTLQLRLARRTPDLAFEGAIHEDLAAWVRRGGRTPRLVDAPFVHLGNAPEVRAARAKGPRNVALLRGRLDREPGDLAAWGHLASELLAAGDPAGAAAAAEAGWARAARGADGVHRLAVVRALLALRRGAAEAALAAVERALELDRPRADYAYLAGRALEALAERQPADGEAQRAALGAAAEAFRAALEGKARPELEHLVVEATRRDVATRLGTALLRAGRGAEAVAAFDVALAGDG